MNRLTGGVPPPPIGRRHPVRCGSSEPQSLFLLGCPPPRPPCLAILHASPYLHKSRPSRARRAGPPPWPTAGLGATLARGYPLAARRSRL